MSCDANQSASNILSGEVKPEVGGGRKEGEITAELCRIRVVCGDVVWTQRR